MDGVAAVQHHVVADINAHMGRAGGVIGLLKEDQVARTCVPGRHRRTCP